MIRSLALLLALSAAAFAGQSQVLVFKDGAKKTYPLVRCDDDGLTVTKGGAETMIPWADLAPTSAYAARKALTPYDDPAARLKLAEFAAKRQLFPEAREQLEIALALGGLGEADFDQRSKQLEEAEVKYLTTRIDLLLRTGAEPGPCLNAIKRLRDRYPTHPSNKVYEPHIQALVDKLAEKAEAEQEATEKKADDKELAALRKKIEKINRRKIKALETAAKLHEESKEAVKKRQVSRVKKKLAEPSGAARYYKRARSYLREMGQLDPKERIVTKEGLRKEWDEIEPKIIECYLQVARTLLQQRNYKGAVKYVRLVLSYDPIHEEALEMVETIRKNRITIKISDLTNARPRVTGG